MAFCDRSTTWKKTVSWMCSTLNSAYSHICLRKVQNIDQYTLDQIENCDVVAAVLSRNFLTGGCAGIDRRLRTLPHRVLGKRIMEILGKNCMVFKWLYLWNRLTDLDALTSG